MCVCCSDEELEDYKALLYLPIAPEVEDPEENPFGPPPDSSVQTSAPEEALAGGDKKQRQPSSEGGPAKKKARTTTIELQGVPSDGERGERSNKFAYQMPCCLYYEFSDIGQDRMESRPLCLSFSSKPSN